MNAANININNFYSNDFLSVLLFGTAGVFLFYLIPFVLFAYFYMQFRGNNENVTLEGLLLRYILYSIMSIITGAIIFSVLDTLSFSSISNASKGLYYFFQFNWVNISNVINEIQNNSHLLASEKNNIKYMAMLLMLLKMIFQTLSIMPIIILLYLIFTGIMKCKKQYNSGGSDINTCLFKKFFYFMLFMIGLYIVFDFADTIVMYLINHFYTNVSLNNNNFDGIYNSAKILFKNVKNQAINII